MKRTIPSNSWLPLACWRSQFDASSLTQRVYRFPKTGYARIDN